MDDIRPEVSYQSQASNVIEKNTSQKEMHQKVFEPMTSEKEAVAKSTEPSDDTLHNHGHFLTYRNEVFS
jgi:hypothetical protein